jgi:hypothetical protein
LRHISFSWDLASIISVASFSGWLLLPLLLLLPAIELSLVLALVLLAQCAFRARVVARLGLLVLRGQSL